MVETVTLEPLDPATAAHALRVCPDPMGDGFTDLDHLARVSNCVRVSGAAGDLVLALQLRRGLVRDVLWINGAAGQGAHDWTRNGLAVAEHQAAQHRAHAVGFQTARRGLVRRAQASGYRMAGFILMKDL